MECSFESTCKCSSCQLSSIENLRTQIKEKDRKILDLRIRVTENLTRAERAEVIAERKRDQCDRLTQICGILSKDVGNLLGALHQTETFISEELVRVARTPERWPDFFAALAVIQTTIAGASQSSTEFGPHDPALLAPIETDSEGRAKIATAPEVE